MGAPRFLLPDYRGGSLINLMSSLSEACSGPALPYARLPLLDTGRLRRARSIVLILIDGLGADYLRRHGRPGGLRDHCLGEITSVFPSTTASAVTSVLTGMAPQQHGLTGWHMYFPEIGEELAILPLRGRVRDAAIPDGTELAPRLLACKGGLHGRFGRPAICVSPADIIDSPFNRWHSEGVERIAYQDLAQMAEAVRAAALAAGEPRFIYAYYPRLDSLSHTHGTDSAEARAELGEIESGILRLAAGLAASGSVLLVTADHGFIDSPPQHCIDLEQHADLRAMLARPLCGERRVAYAYVAEGFLETFRLSLEARFAEALEVVPAARLLEEEWFGPGAAHPRLHERIGDYALLMRDDWTIVDWAPGERRHAMIGVHGGLSEAEMRVPLIWLEP